jgi:phosphatidylglycerophosphate synthase
VVSLSLLRSAQLAVGLVMSGTLLGAGALASFWPLSPWFVPKALALPFLWFVLVLPRLHEHGRPTLGPANTITMARGVLTALFAAFAFEPLAEDFVWGLVFAAWLAFFLDWVDGRVARTTGSASPFGARLDMELDALAVLALCALAFSLGRAGAWVWLSGALRYLFVAASLAWPWMSRPLFPTPRRAWVCGVQIVCLVGCLVPLPWPSLSWAIASFGTVALVASFAVDTAWLYTRRLDP